MNEQHAVVCHTDNPDTCTPIVLVCIKDDFYEAQSVMEECYNKNLEQMVEYMEDMGNDDACIHDYLMRCWCVADNAHVEWPGIKPSPYWYIASTI